MIWVIELEFASSGAFSNPFEIRRTLRQVFWEGLDPARPVIPGQPPSEEEVEERMGRAAEIAATLKANRAPDKAAMLAAMMGDPDLGGPSGVGSAE